MVFLQFQVYVVIENWFFLREKLRNPQNINQQLLRQLLNIITFQLAQDNQAYSPYNSVSHYHVEVHPQIRNFAKFHTPIFYQSIQLFVVLQHGVEETRKES
jgi:hypothetical protein